MLNIITLLLDVVFPPRKTELLVRSTNLLTLNQTPKKIPTNNTAYLLDYADPVVQALIIENKYHNNGHAASILSQYLYSWIKTTNEPLVLVPIPLGKKREFERGYNQVVNILSKLPDSSKYSTDASIVCRVRETTPQTSLEKNDRLKNMINSFACVKPERLRKYSGCTFVIIDDVTTTGATLEAARATLAPLLPASTKLICLALAH